MLTVPELGSSLEIAGAGTVTVKVTPALDCPPAVTTTGPVVAPDGTFVSISSVAQLVVDAVVPLKVTVPEEPKLDPSMVTWVFTVPNWGPAGRLTGAGVVTVKVTPALDCPPDVLTTTGPVVAPDGTFVSISPLAQLVVEAVVPLKVTEPEEPKLEPSMVTDVFTVPELGSSLEIAGAGTVTVKVTPALDCPPAVTTTGPVVAPDGTLV